VRRFPWREDCPDEIASAWPLASYTGAMWLIAFIAVLILAGSFYADWRWRRWVEARRRDRKQADREQ